jgi:hypothetical protein
MDACMSRTKFALSFTAGGLLYNESIVVAEALLRNEYDWNATLVEVEEKNLLQSRTCSTSKRKLREISQRLKCLSEPQLALLVDGTRHEQKLILWLACCEKYPLLAELARDVVRAKFLQLDYSIDAGDIARFIELQTLWHEELEGLTASTITKLQTVMLRMLRESELVSEDGIISAPLVSGRFIQALKADSPGGLLYFPLVIENGGLN